jgi:hypothetical protein
MAPLSGGSGSDPLVLAQVKVVIAAPSLRLSLPESTTF